MNMLEPQFRDQNPTSLSSSLPSNTFAFIAIGMMVFFSWQTSALFLYIPSHPNSIIVQVYIMSNIDL